MSSTNPSYTDPVVSSSQTPDDSEDLRERVLRASVALIEEEGLANLSMREVARRAGVSHQAPYHYFSDREAILAAVAERGFELLGERLTEARQKATSATEALELAGVAYITFACDYPAHFRMMFRPELVKLSDHHEVDGCADSAFKHVPELVIDCMKQGYLPNVSVESISALLWSVAHGCACLLLDGPLLEKIPTFGQNREQAVRDMTQTLRCMVEATLAIK